MGALLASVKSLGFFGFVVKAFGVSNKSTLERFFCSCAGVDIDYWLLGWVNLVLRIDVILLNLWVLDFWRGNFWGLSVVAAGGTAGP